MIVSRRRLTLRKGSKTGDSPGLMDTLHFDKDGTAVAMDRFSVIVAQPEEINLPERFRNLETPPPDEGINIPDETIKRVLKLLPRKSAGEEVFCVLSGMDESSATFTFIDEKGTQEIKGPASLSEFLPWRDILQNVWRNIWAASSFDIPDELPKNRRVCLVLSKLIEVLKTIQDCAGSKDSLIMIDFALENQPILIRNVSDQKIMAMIRPVSMGGNWPELSTWEKRILFKRKAKPKRKKPKRKSEILKHFRRG